jgi:hypothetical protein
LHNGSERSNSYSRTFDFIVEYEALAEIAEIAKKFDNVESGICLAGSKIKIFMTTSFQSEPYAIPNEITEALLKMFGSIANAIIRTKNHVATSLLQTVALPSTILRMVAAVPDSRT